MPSAPVTNSRMVPSLKQYLQDAVKYAKETHPEIFNPDDPIRRFRRIMYEARKTHEKTGFPLPEGLHKIER